MHLLILEESKSKNKTLDTLNVLHERNKIVKELRIF